MNTLNSSIILKDSALRVPQKTFINENEKYFSFQDIETDACRFANVLNGLGIKYGDRVALLIPNVAFFATCQYGALKLGAVVVPLSMKAPASEIAYFLQDSEAFVLVAFSSIAKAAQEGFESTESCQHLLIVDSEDSNFSHPSVRLMAELMNNAKANFETIELRLWLNI